MNQMNNFSSVKSAFITLACLVFVIGIIFNAAVVFSVNEPEMYPKFARVVAVDESIDLVVFEDCNGFTWEWTGVEDWCVNDYASLLMNDNNTGNIFDDIIIKAYYTNNF